jgi:hypothetical protein
MPHLENTVTNIVNVTNITNCVGCTNTSPTTTTQGSLLTNIVSAVVSFTNFPQIIITNVTLPTVPQKGIDGPPPPPHYTMISPSTLWITVLMTAAVAAWRIRTIMRRISYSKSERHAPGHSWKEAIDLIDSFTTIISTQFRTVALALLSMSVLGFVRTGLQFAGADVLGQRDSRLYLAAIGFFALLALVCDYLQYLSGLLTTLIINMREDLRDSVYLAFVVSPRFRWLRFFFWAKQVTLILAAVLFLELAASFIWYVVRHG